MRLRFLFALLLFAGPTAFAAADASLPAVSKKQVYELFTKKTGLLLNDVISAIKGDEASRKKIQKFSLAQNPDSVIFAYTEQIKKDERDCLAHSASSSLCQKQAAEISKDIETLKKQSHKALAGELTAKTLQWHLAVLSHIVDEQVIGKFMGEWVIQCDKSGKMNSASCKATLESVGQFQELMSNFLVWNLKFYGGPEVPKVNESTIREAAASYGK